MPNTNVITPAQAIAQGSSSSDLMSIANGLERLARGYLVEAAALDSTSYQNRETRRELKAQADVNTQNAASLRRVARAIRNKVDIRVTPSSGDIFKDLNVERPQSSPARVQRVVKAIEAELPMSQRLR